jgi:hypothetical protein
MGITRKDARAESTAVWYLDTPGQEGGPFGLTIGMGTVGKGTDSDGLHPRGDVSYLTDRT